MSKFRVKLNNEKQGLLDVNPSTGAQFDVSVQRQIFATGPNGVHRLLKDGEEFEDCNYWKRFAFPQVSKEEAFIEVVEDDGSVYSDNPEENIAAVGGSLNIDTSYANAEVDFVSTYGGPARFLQFKNTDGTATVDLRLNGDDNLVVSLGPGETQIFNNGDLMISKIDAKVSSGTATASWIGSVQIMCQS